MINRALLILTLLTSCLIPGSVRAGEISATDLEFFEKKIRPILSAHCYECHAGDEDSGGLRLDSAPSISMGGDSGPAISTENPPASLLLVAVEYQNPDLQMPPEQKLSADQIADLRDWVSRGAPDPRTEITPKSAPAVTGMSLAEGKQFWSFRPVERPDVPASDEGTHPVDAYVLAELKQQGLTPAESADRLTLLRRVTFDLTGLPPTVAEQQEFLNDTSAQAWENLIERLLASPQYGVHWGRHWLDVARYADSNGLDENLAYGHAWRYRDYVVDSFNADKPYDRFILEQLAGDLLPDATQETRTATGFLALGAKVLAEPDLVKLEMDIIDEQLDTMGKALWGMTLGCVRCHDHKFDPMTQQDYYALAAIFKSTKNLAGTNTGAIKHWYEHSFATDEDKAQIEKVEAEIKEKNKVASTYKNQAISRIQQEANSKAAEYLAAATRITPGMSLTQIARVAESFEIHPRILQNCRLYLDNHPEEKRFAFWREHQTDADPQVLLDHYRSYFATPPELSESEKTDEKAVARHKFEFLLLPDKPEHILSDEEIAEYHRLLEEARLFESRAADEPAAMGVGEGEVIPQLAIHIRGSHNNLGQEVPRDVPAIFKQDATQLAIPEGESGRLQLAQWAVDPRHPLTARVMVNRIWGWHFGQPLVTTTENFGALGAAPSHPELLEWLTAEFVSSGWSIKTLHRLILTSKTYQLAYEHPNFTSHQTIDPGNRYLWRAHLQRLQAESVRDSILSVAGILDDSLGGKTIPLRNRQFVFNHTSQDHTRYDSLRRAIYLPVVRNNLYPLFSQFDFPDPTMPTGHRSQTIVAPQALLLLNSDLISQAAEQFARRILDSSPNPSDRVKTAYQLAYCREPDHVEAELIQKFLTSQTPTIESELTIWTQFCHSLLASNEFIYLK
ncbi:MAG: PSD1 domain-containing protein [Planctomycetaceae bacterium]|nr:PSD1 domain-containing protein [Planctomycetaceae bacterium]